MTSNTNQRGNTLPLTEADVQLAANESSFAPLPGFCLTAPALRESFDSMADSAMVGLERITHAFANVPADIQPLLADLRALFGSIGHTADSTSDDISTDLAQVWGL